MLPTRFMRQKQLVLFLPSGFLGLGSKKDKIGSSLRVHGLVGAVLRKNFSTELRRFRSVDLLSLSLKSTEMRILEKNI